MSPEAPIPIEEVMPGTAGDATTVRDICPMVKHALEKRLHARAMHPRGFLVKALADIAYESFVFDQGMTDHDRAAALGRRFAEGWIRKARRDGTVHIAAVDAGKWPRRYKPTPAALAANVNRQQQAAAIRKFERAQFTAANS